MAARGAFSPSFPWDMFSSVSSFPPDPPSAGGFGAPPPPPGAGAPRPGGCLRKGLVGCGVVGFALLLACVGAVLYLRRNPQVVTDYAVRQVEEHCAPDVTGEDKADFRAAYAAYRERLRSGSSDPRPAQQLRSVLMQGGSRNEFTREQVHALTESFRQAAAAGAASPVPTATPTP